MKRVEKGWGYEVWIVNKEYCGKLLYFREGKRCSWHYHLVKDEVFYLQSGRLLIKHASHDDLDRAQKTVLIPGMSFSVRTGVRHQMIALEESELFEFSTHHEEADSIRVLKGD